jgi:hypothetical protein
MLTRPSTINHSNGSKKNRMRGFTCLPFATKIRLATGETVLRHRYNSSFRYKMGHLLGMGGAVSPVGIAAAVAVVAGVSLAGCSSMSSIPLSEQFQPLNFESDPAGAEIRTTQGQTCITPCALTVLSQEQPVTITRDGYMPQTVQVTTGSPPDHLFWQHPPPTFVPNPVHVVLQPVPKSVHHAKGNRLVLAPAPSRASDLSSPTQGSAAKGVAARFSAFPPSPPPPKQ